jgi:hypothetical protein
MSARLNHHIVATEPAYLLLVENWPSFVEAFLQPDQLCQPVDLGRVFVDDGGQLPLWFAK